MILNYRENLVDGLRSSTPDRNRFIKSNLAIKMGTSKYPL